jgi:hypothetical protein
MAWAGLDPSGRWVVPPPFSRVFGLKAGGAVGARRPGGERQAPLRDLTRWGGKPLPWAHLTISQVIEGRKVFVGAIARGPDGVC